MLVLPVQGRNVGNVADAGVLQKIADVDCTGFGIALGSSLDPRDLYFDPEMAVGRTDFEAALGILGMGWNLDNCGPAGCADLPKGYRSGY